MANFADFLDEPKPDKRETLTASLSETGDLEFEGLAGDSPTPPTETGDPALAPVFEMFGLDPAEFEIVGQLGASAWQQRTRDGEVNVLRAYRGRLRRKLKTELSADEYANLIMLAGTVMSNSVTHNKKRALPTRVVVMGDLQCGKTDERGGTAELARRIDYVLSELNAINKREPAKAVLLVEPGDLVEGINSTASQAYMNDLSMPAQLTTARQNLARIIGELRQWTPETHVLTCTSNHAAWRDGKGYLGRPGDDYGLDVHKAVQEAYTLAGIDVTWHLPDPWREYTVCEVNGTRYALTHGHRARNKQSIPQWWQGQAFAHPEDLTGVSYYLNGHWHSPYSECVGEGKWRIQSGALDGGSAWFTNSTGISSRATVTTYRVDKHGQLNDYRVIEIPF